MKRSGSGIVRSTLGEASVWDRQARDRVIRPWRNRHDRATTASASLDGIVELTDPRCYEWVDSGHACNLEDDKRVVNEAEQVGAPRPSELVPQLGLESGQLGLASGRKRCGASD